MYSFSSRYTSFVNQYPYENAVWAGKVTVCFSHAQSGWVQVWVAGTSFLQDITIHASHVGDPFPSMVAWLEAIAQNQLPAEFTIDEEGKGKTLLVFPWEQNLLDFQIREHYSIEEELYFRMRVNRRQLIAEFVQKFEHFLKEYHEPAQWEHGRDLFAIDLSTLHRYLDETKG